jgi:4-hydroxybutyryl-CoA dehydratase/vinylacetyl-CoA-Delta-isomerase
LLNIEQLNVAQLWAPFKPIVTADDYVASLRGRGLNVFYLGEHVDEPSDHPVIIPSINAVAETYRLAMERPKLGAAITKDGSW